MIDPMRITLCLPQFLQPVHISLIPTVGRSILGHLRVVFAPDFQPTCLTMATYCEQQTLELVAGVHSQAVG